MTELSWGVFAGYMAGAFFFGWVGAALSPSVTTKRKFWIAAWMLFLTTLLWPVVIAVAVIGVAVVWPVVTVGERIIKLLERYAALPINEPVEEKKKRAPRRKRTAAAE